ncbi:MAG: hypothetical protein KKC79_08170 [Gammaproteobacteria bacterium]|nr:hypothetical protein [Gammaproteobacteria bacterium]MBU1442723.1 hypothetical protein [Gammaproteobacteria bacterium]MBU2287022.1 hypothetical protein [Gammaproteobacteria bacterium]MBU2408611.1 hypothetical protein [Gammaproteobacteria bacterium]
MSAAALELRVDEPVEGQFFWVVRTLAQGDGEASVESASAPLPSYGEAMRAGIAALQERADARGVGDAAPVVTVVVDPANELQSPMASPIRSTAQHPTA